jgi:enoyl-CoA hydratase/carnithine racemase
MNDRVEITINGPIAEVALNRADKYNALDTAMFDAISAAGESLRQNDEIRAVVLYGKGDNFCSGLDVSSFGDLGDNATFRKTAAEHIGETPANRFQHPSYVWQSLDLPVIAALQGVAFGGGSQIALGADMRIAHSNTRLSVMEIKWGLIPDMGITQSLPKLVGMDVAKELLMTGRIVEAAECRELGLVTYIDDEPLARARAIAAEIAGKSPDAIRRWKKLLESSGNASAEQGLALEAELQGESIFMPHQIEAVMANMEKREPVFK